MDALDPRGKKIIIRVDFNVPMDKQTGKITDDTRIQKALPTLHYVLDNGGSAILISHMGRPKGQRDSFVTMQKTADHLSTLLSNKIYFSEDAIGPKAGELAKNLKSGEILVLENIRFYPEETSKEKSERTKFAQAIAIMGDTYIDDAFGSCHRAHASIVELAEQLPAYAGLLLKKEVDILERILKKPEKPFVAVIGGAKVSSKITVLEKLIEKVDTILIGGAMAYTFLKSRALETGNSMVETEYLSKAFQIIDKANFHKTGFFLPEDHLVASEFSEKAKTKTVGKEIPTGWMGMDIGPKTIDRYSKIIKDAKTVLWNGPMGVFEMQPYSKGTYSIAKAMSKMKGTSVVGGGDSVLAVKNAGMEDKITHVSTGGGATLEYLEGKILPGIAILDK